MIRLLALLLALPALARAQQGTLLDPVVRKLLSEELSGEIAKEHVIGITRFHRIQGSRGYHEAAQWVLAKLQEYGFDEQHAWIETFPADGKIDYQTWQSPSGWHVDSAELRMVEPRDERIVGFPEIAMSLVTYSNPGDVTAELVWVGDGTKESDYAGKDVKGKFVLATGYGGAVHRQAVLAHGAAAVVCYLDDERAAEHPDMLQYTGMWPKPDELERTTFGFNLTNRQGEALRALLESGKKVVLHGKVEGEGLENFVMSVVVAKIDGTTRPQEELLFSAHLDHPKESANDNASGSGAILDVARGLWKLIDAKRLPAPQRTLRFLWVPEWHGTMAYIDGHEELLGPRIEGQETTTLANLNLDMVGEDTEKLHSRLILTRSPLAVAGALDAVVGDMASMVDELDVRTPRGSRSTFHWRQTPFSGGSDHMMFLDRGIPSVMFSHDPDYTHHTSEDTPDKVDPVELERCELIAAGALWSLANLDQRGAAELAWSVGADAMARLDEGARTVRAGIKIDGVAPDAVRQRLREADDALVALGSLLEGEFVHAQRFDPAPGEDSRFGRLLQAQRDGLRARVQNARRALAVEFNLSAPPDEKRQFRDVLAEQKGPAARIVLRRTRGPLAFDLPARALPPERAAWYSADGCPFQDSERRFELLNFANLGLPLGGIRVAYSAEHGPVSEADVVRVFEDLETIGLVVLRDPAAKQPSKD